MTGDITAAEGPYAVCNDCGAEQPTRDDARAHMSATLPKDGRGHSVRVVTPTPDEIAQRLVDRAVGDAIERALEDIDRLVYRGTCSEADVTAALRSHPDFAEVWGEYRA